MKRTWMVAAALTLAAIGSAQIDPNKVVATVNGEQITGNEYYHRMEFLQGVSMKFGEQTVVSTPGFFTLTQLIGEHLLYQLAKQKGDLPSEAEIDNELQLRRSADPNYIQEQADEGISEADLRDSIKYDLTKFKLQTDGITVTDQEVQDYYKKNPDQFMTPKRLHVRLIAVKQQQGERAVDDALKSADFPSVAKQLSEDVTKGTGGDLGTVPLTYFSKDAQSSLNGLKIGSTTNWIPIHILDEMGNETSDIRAYVKYQLVDVQPAAMQPLDKSLIISTRRILMIRKGQQKNDLTKEIDDMRSKAKVQIASKQYQELWNQMAGS